MKKLIALLLLTISIAHGQTLVQCRNGGTGLTSYTIGDMLYLSATCTFSKLAAPAVGQVLISNGTSTAPSWSASPTLTGTLTSGATDALHINRTGGLVSFYNTAGSTRTGYIQEATGNLAFVGEVASSTLQFYASNALIHTTNTTGITLGNTRALLFGTSPVMTNTAPTIAAGLCTSPAVTSSNGTAAFLLTVGTSCAGVSTGTLTMPAAATGWVCHFANVTAPASNVPSQTGGTTTSVTFTNYARTTGLAADFTASNAIRVMCSGY
jgi:hypothetical protein